MSVRRRLLISLIALVVIVDGLAGLLTYRRALQSTALLLDYQLQQMALSLRDQGSAVPDLPASTPGQFEFAIQIWNKDGAPIYTSRPDVPLRHESLDGFGDLSIENETWRAFALHTPRRIILVAQSEDVREAWARAIALKAIGPLLILMPILAIAAWFVVLRALDPIKRVAGEFSTRDANSLSPVVIQDLPQEVAPMVTEVNRLLDRLASAFSLQRAFIADAAHELRSPLTALNLHLQLFLRAKTPAEQAESGQKLQEAMRRATALVQQLLTLARSEPAGASMQLDSVHLDAVVSEAANDCSALATARGSDLSVKADAPVGIRGDPESLRIMTRNLIDNALRYTPPGGRVVVQVDREGADARVQVSDSGPGLPEEERERVFDRFYRREAMSETGSGLGLAIVKTIVQRHGGRVQLDQSSLGGLKATIRIPVAAT